MTEFDFVRNSVMILGPSKNGVSYGPGGGEKIWLEGVQKVISVTRFSSVLYQYLTLKNQLS